MAKTGSWDSKFRDCNCFRQCNRRLQQ